MITLNLNLATLIMDGVFIFIGAWTFGHWLGEKLFGRFGGNG